jgi:hypothetical protein
VIRLEGCCVPWWELLLRGGETTTSIVPLHQWRPKKLTIDRTLFPKWHYGKSPVYAKDQVQAEAFEIVDVIVRREKAVDFSGCNSRPGTGSLHPVAIEAAAEATKLSELSM